MGLSILGLGHRTFSSSEYNFVDLTGKKQADGYIVISKKELELTYYVNSKVREKGLVILAKSKSYLDNLSKAIMFILTGKGNSNVTELSKSLYKDDNLLGDKLRLSYKCINRKDFVSGGIQGKFDLLNRIEEIGRSKEKIDDCVKKSKQNTEELEESCKSAEKVINEISAVYKNNSNVKELKEKNDEAQRLYNIFLKNLNEYRNLVFEIQKNANEFEKVKNKEEALECRSRVVYYYEKSSKILNALYKEGKYSREYTEILGGIWRIGNEVKKLFRIKEFENMDSKDYWFNLYSDCQEFLPKAADLESKISNIWDKMEEAQKTIGFLLRNISSVKNYEEIQKILDRATLIEKEIHEYCSLIDNYYKGDYNICYNAIRHSYNEVIRKKIKYTENLNLKELFSKFEKNFNKLKCIDDSINKLCKNIEIAEINIDSNLEKIKSLADRLKPKNSEPDATDSNLSSSKLKNSDEKIRKIKKSLNNFYIEKNYEEISKIAKEAYSEVWNNIMVDMDGISLDGINMNLGIVRFKHELNKAMCAFETIIKINNDLIKKDETDDSAIKCLDDVKLDTLEIVKRFTYELDYIDTLIKKSKITEGSYKRNFTKLLSQTVSEVEKIKKDVNKSYDSTKSKIDKIKKRLSKSKKQTLDSKK